MFLTDRFTWPSRAYPPTYLLTEPDGLFRDTWPGWSDSRLLPDKLIPTYVCAPRGTRGEAERRRIRVLQLSAFVLPATDVLIKMLDKPLTRAS